MLFQIKKHGSQVLTVVVVGTVAIRVDRLALKPVDLDLTLVEVLKLPRHLGRDPHRLGVQVQKPGRDNLLPII